MNQFNAKRISFGVQVSRWEVNKLGEFTPLILRLQLRGKQNNFPMMKKHWATNLYYIRLLFGDGTSEFTSFSFFLIKKFQKKTKQVW
jgi:hypothetical protein